MNYTKEQLQDMSDFEVNKALHLKLLTRKPKEGLESITYRPSGAFDVRFKSGANFLSHLKDYCNNHNDIMPLAFDRGVYYYNGTAFTNIIDYIDDSTVFDEPNFFYPKNPLRAIACVILMMEV